MSGVPEAKRRTPNAERDAPTGAEAKCAFQVIGSTETCLARKDENITIKMINGGYCL